MYCNTLLHCPVFTAHSPATHTKILKFEIYNLILKTLIFLSRMSLFNAYIAQNKTKWATSIYKGKETKKITKLFKEI
jgi:hypothetical protein